MNRSVIYTSLAVFLLLCSMFMLFSCSSFLKNQVDQVEVENLLKKLRPQTDSISHSAAYHAITGASEGTPELVKQFLKGLKGATDTLNPDIEKIMRTVDSLGSLSAAQLQKIGNSLDAQIARLKTDLKDEEIKAYLIKTIQGMTGALKKETQNLLADMIQRSLDSLATESSHEKIRSILDQFLGADTQQKAQLLVSNALQPTMDTLLKRIDKIVHKDVPFVQRQANKLLLLLGLIAAGIIGFVWYQRMKYAKLVSLLTLQIDKIPSQNSYDELTHRIKNEAQRDGLETTLRSILQDQGINS